MPSESPTTVLLLALSALAAGVMNSVAGGGTLLTFPALTLVMDARAANATSTLALMPGSLAGAWAFRRELGHARHWVRLLIVPSLVGGLIGSLLVAVLPESVFAALVPWLILGATLLFLAQPLVTRLTGVGRETHEPSGRVKAAVVAFQFLVAVYGGYFGAGIGILMLSALSLMGLGDLTRMNAVKTLLAAAINAVSVGVFVWGGLVRWPYALVMAAAAVVGGYLGAAASRHLPKALGRWVVIVIGLALAAYYFARGRG